MTISGQVANLILVLLWSNPISLFSTKKLQILRFKPNEGLEYACELLIAKNIKCELDGPYPLEDTAKLIQDFGKDAIKEKL